MKEAILRARGYDIGSYDNGISVALTPRDWGFGIGGSYEYGVFGLWLRFAFLRLDGALCIKPALDMRNEKQQAKSE